MPMSGVRPGTPPRTIAAAGRRAWTLVAVAAVALGTGCGRDSGPLVLDAHIRDFSLEDAVVVPDDCASIDEAVERAIEGDVIVLRPGVYTENVELRKKNVLLTSLYALDGDRRFVEETVIDGLGEVAVHATHRSAGSTVCGLTLRNADTGIRVEAPIRVLHCRITATRDALNYKSGGGGMCLFNVLTNNLDDGVDLDDEVAVTVASNRILHNADDGIEIRLNPYDGPLLEIVIADNVLAHNGEDGIQLIGYEVATDREIRILRNRIVGNAMAAVGIMGDAETVENFEGEPIEDLVLIAGNSIVANAYGIVGGGNSRILDNVIVGTTHSAIRRVAGRSIIRGNTLWNNGVDYEESTAPRGDGS